MEAFGWFLLGSVCSLCLGLPAYRAWMTALGPEVTVPALRARSEASVPGWLATEAGKQVENDQANDGDPPRSLSPLWRALGTT
jgi:hypothetical protein